MPVPLSSHFEDQAIGHHQRDHVAAGPRMLAGVDEALAHDGEGVVADVLRHRVVHGALEADFGSAPESRFQLLREMQDGLAQPARQRGVTELEDGRRIWVMVSSSSSTALDSLDDHASRSASRDGALEAHADGEDALDDPVVEVPGDAVPIVEHAEDVGPGRGAGCSRWRCRPRAPGPRPSPRPRR